MSRTPTGTTGPSIRRTSSARRQIVPAIRDPHEDHVGGALVALQDLVGDPGEGAPDVVGLHDLGAQKGTPPRASREADVLACKFSLPSRPRGTGLKGMNGRTEHTGRPPGGQRGRFLFAASC